MKKLYKEYKIILSAVIGVIIEFYDFTLYGIFSHIFALNFFAYTYYTSLLCSFAIFAVGFIGRPIGAILFGYIGDKFGRSKSLFFSILLMSFSTILIGILPTYKDIGIFASVLLVVCRLLQGISTGGEYGIAAVFLIEHLTDKKAFGGSLIVAAALIGALLATLSSMIGTNDNWRIFFIMGGILALFGLVFRYYVRETSEFLDLLADKKMSHYPLRDVFRNYLSSFFIIVFIGGYAGGVAYCLIVFSATYIKLFSKISMQVSLLYSCIGMTFFIISSLFSGYLARRINEAFILFSVSLLSIFLLVPIFVGLQSSSQKFIIMAMTALGILAGGYGGCFFLFSSKLFPPSVRCTAVTLSHAVGLAIFGGSFPFVSLWLIKYFQCSLAPAFYLILLAILGLLSLKNSLIDLILGKRLFSK